MVVAGLTGGIASGKSTVSGFLSEAGARIVCADRLARQVVEPGEPAWQAIIDHFGGGIVAPDGQLDRKRLGDIIFNDPAEKAVLDRLTHPAVFAAMEDEVQSCGRDEIVILDVPLLIESGLYRDLEHVIVVYVPQAVQLERLMARDGISLADALARITSQMPIDEKRRYASWIIENDGSPEQTRTSTLAVFSELQKLA